MQFDFTYENTPALHRDVIAAITKHAGVTRRLWWLVVAVPAVMTASNALDAANRASVGRFLSVIAPWWIIYPTLFLLFMKWSVSRSAKRSMAEDATQQGTQNRRLDEKGLHLHNTVMNASVGWPAIQSAVETPHFFLLFQNRSCGYALPKTALQNATSREVRDFLSRQLNERARLLTD